MELTEKERAFVFRVAMKYMRNQDKAADVTQDALLLAYRNRHSFRGESKLTTWLYRITVTTACMHLRRERTQFYIETSVYANENKNDKIADNSLTPEGLIGAREVLKLVEDTLVDTDEKNAHIFSSYFIEGHSANEIAADLGISFETVKVRIFRLRAFLENRLGDSL